MAMTEEQRLAEADRCRIMATILQIKAARLEANLSQRDVAKRMKARQSTVSDIESLNSDIQLSTLQRYARACGVPIDAKIDRMTYAIAS